MPKPQVFKPRSTIVFRVVLLGGMAIVFLAGLIGFGGKWSGFMTETGAPLEQPVPFSHKHHVGGLGLDCRYCHFSVERSATAGMPSTHTCMTCHSQIWAQAKMLEPVRRSEALGQPLQWNRVYRVPKYVYFNHSIHVEKGIGCTTCHGAVDEMPIVWKTKPFYMRECVACHRDPERYLRAEEDIFSTKWKPPADQLALGAKLVEKYHTPKRRLTNCMTCHR